MQSLLDSEAWFKLYVHEECIRLNLANSQQELLKSHVVGAVTLLLTDQFLAPK